MVVGTANDGGPSPPPGDFAVVRYNADGSLDTTFSGDGKQTTDFAGGDIAHDVVLQPDGRIVAIGNSGEEVGFDIAVARYNSDGSYDAGFSGDGKQTTDIELTDYAYGVALQADGKILGVGGRAAGSGGAPTAFALMRYNADGSLDTTFSEDGVQTTDLGPNGPEDHAVLSDVALQEDGKIVAVGEAGGYSEGESDLDLTVARYSPNGSLDPTFSGDGLQSTEFNEPQDDWGRAVVIQSDGRVVVAGYLHDNDPGTDTERDGFTVARYDPSGALDATFSGDGKQILSFGGDNGASGIALQGDGAIIVVGGASGGFALARYEGGGTPPPPVSPVFSDTDPNSPANDNLPRIKGMAAAGTTVKLYTNSACTTAIAAQGTAAAFASPGLTVTVPNDSSTRFYATATDAAARTSACSSSSIAYVERSTVPPPPPPPPPPPVAAIDGAPPLAKLVGSKSQKLGKTVVLSTSCLDEACAATVSGTVHVPKVRATKAKTYTLPKTTKALARGAKITFKVKLSTTLRSAIRRALRAGKKITVKLKVVVADAAGNKKTLTRQVKLKL